jgi:8-hydroxy-5-deazaflavin:NADPH oxidoreductase
MSVSGNLPHRPGLMKKIGFFPVDLEALDIGGPLASLPFGPLSGVSFVKL